MYDSKTNIQTASDPAVASSGWLAGHGTLPIPAPHWSRALHPVRRLDNERDTLLDTEHWSDVPLMLEYGQRPGSGTPGQRLSIFMRPSQKPAALNRRSPASGG
jgi:hypothetical protein